MVVVVVLVVAKGALCTAGSTSCQAHQHHHHYPLQNVCRSVEHCGACCCSAATTTATSHSSSHSSKQGGPPELCSPLSGKIKAAALLVIVSVLQLVFFLVGSLMQSQACSHGGRLAVQQTAANRAGMVLVWPHLHQQHHKQQQLLLLLRLHLQHHGGQGQQLAQTG